MTVIHCVGPDLCRVVNDLNADKENIFNWLNGNGSQQQSPGQTGPQVDASFKAKPELAYGLAMGGQTTKNLRRLAYEFELDPSQPKSRQVGSQMKRKLMVSLLLASTCESV